MDSAIFNALHAFVGMSAVLDWVGVAAAEYLPWALGVWALVVIGKVPSRVKKFEYFIFATLSVLVSRGILTEIVRYATERPRPFVLLNFVPLVERSATFSFPSGHAAVFFALAVALWFIDRRTGWWFGALALVNGIARVYVGVHWPTDILAGAAIGILSTLAVKLLLDKIPKRAS